MTRQEAVAIARAIAVADNGCEICVNRVCRELNRFDLGWHFETCLQGDPNCVVDEDPDHAAVAIHAVTAELDRR